jgi:hypothetical protein
LQILELGVPYRLDENLRPLGKIHQKRHPNPIPAAQKGPDCNQTDFSQIFIIISNLKICQLGLFVSWDWSWLKFLRSPLSPSNKNNF